MISIENILRKHITRETHKDSHARIVVHLAVDIRAEIYRELEKGLRLRKLPLIGDGRSGADRFQQKGFCFARSRALGIVKGEEI